MKRFLGGCLVVFAVLLVGGGLLAYFTVGRPALAATAAARDLARIPQIEAQVARRDAFQPPADGEMSTVQVERYLAAASQVTERLKGRFAVLDERYRELRTDDGSLGFREAITAWSDVIGLVVEAKEYQVEALNQHGFSLQEYAWVRSQVLSAAGHAVMQVDLAQLVASGGDPTVRQLSSEVPQANVELVEPYADRLGEFAPLAMFGL